MSTFPSKCSSVYVWHFWTGPYVSHVKTYQKSMFRSCSHVWKHSVVCELVWSCHCSVATEASNGPPLEGNAPWANLYAERYLWPVGGGVGERNVCMEKPTRAILWLNRRRPKRFFVLLKSGLKVRSTSNSLLHISTIGPFSAVTTQIFASKY